MTHLISFAAGLIFALGLAISGMTDPSKVTGFLDVLGAWDPSLALVMAAAVAVHALPARLAARGSRPLLAERFHLAPFVQIDGPLVVGSALFGVGWGLAGYCPGPALVAAAAGRTEALLFTGAMFAGFAAHAWAVSPRRATLPEVALPVAGE